MCICCIGLNTFQQKFTGLKSPNWVTAGLSLAGDVGIDEKSQKADKDDTARKEQLDKIEKALSGGAGTRGNYEWKVIGNELKFVSSNNSFKKIEHTKLEGGYINLGEWKVIGNELKYIK